MPITHTLTPKDAKYLSLEINGKTYNIPLSKTLKVRDLRKVSKIRKLDEDEQFDAMVDFLSGYMSEEVVDDLTAEDVEEIFTLWNKANEITNGPSLGESLASQS